MVKLINVRLAGLFALAALTVFLAYSNYQTQAKTEPQVSVLATQSAEQTTRLSD